MEKPEILSNLFQPLKRKWHCCSLNTFNAYLKNKVVFSESINKSWGVYTWTDSNFAETFYS